MGYEIVYSYHPKDDDGNYKKDEVNELKKKLGEPFEDITIEKLASTIMSQLARRDIWIFDVKIHELVKREISFRETKGGIVIKNKKFLLDSEANIVMQVVEETPARPPTGLVNIAVPALPALPARTGRPIKWITLDLDERNLATVRGKGWAFTPDKRYPVYVERQHPEKFGVTVYQVHDDNKKEVTVEDTYFLNADQLLQKGFNSSLDKEVGGPKLQYDNAYQDVIPDIRGGTSRPAGPRPVATSDNAYPDVPDIRGRR